MWIKGVNIPIVISAVSPHLEYCVSFWTPHLKRNMDKLECVQTGLTRTASDWKLYYTGMTEGPGMFSLGNKCCWWET